MIIQKIENSYRRTMSLFATIKGIVSECIVAFDPCLIKTVTNGGCTEAVGAPEGTPYDGTPKLNSSLNASSSALNGCSLVPSSILLSTDEGSMK